ncbi:MAG: sigma-70 family RNA polymerase sigma factor [Solirubrobacteraceae bacterium]
MRRAQVETLFAEHARAVLAYARRRTDYATASDVVSDVFVVALQRLEDVPPSDPLPWLLACARRVLLNQRRGQQRRTRLFERLAANAPRLQPEHELSDGALASALATIGERDREALLLTAWEGLTAEQAARVLGCSTQAFWVRSHRARKRLAAALENNTTTPTLTMEACND